MCSAPIPLSYPKAPEYLNKRMENVGFLVIVNYHPLLKHVEIFMGLVALFLQNFV